MNSATISATNEKKDKKRGMFIAFFLHGALILLGLLPFMSQLQPEEEPQFSDVIVMDFTDFKPASKEGAKPKKVSNKTQKKKAKAKKSIPKAKPVPKPKPAPKAPQKKVITTPDPEPPITPTPTEKETPKEAPMEKPDPKVDNPSPADMEPEAEEAVDDTANESAAEANKTNTSTSGSGSGNKDNGKLDRGDNWGETAGDGIFNRRVIYRADVKKITEQEGKIVIELCINQNGTVVYAKADKPKSTIKDNNVIRKAVHLTTKYRFERDRTAPRKQCGKMTYIFEIEKE